jgi:hypothetical protein
MAFMKCSLIPRVCTPEPLNWGRSGLPASGRLYFTLPLPASPTPSRRPSLLKLRLGLFKGRHAARARHRTVDGQRPGPAQTVGTAVRLIDATNIPLATVDGVVRGPYRSRRAELEERQGA